VIPGPLLFVRPAWAVSGVTLSSFEDSPTASKTGCEASDEPERQCHSQSYWLWTLSFGSRPVPQPTRFAVKPPTTPKGNPTANEICCEASNDPESQSHSQRDLL